MTTTCVCTPQASSHSRNYTSAVLVFPLAVTSSWFLQSDLSPLQVTGVRYFVCHLWLMSSQCSISVSDFRCRLLPLASANSWSRQIVSEISIMDVCHQRPVANSQSRLSMITGYRRSLTFLANNYITEQTNPESVLCVISNHWLMAYSQSRPVQHKYMYHIHHLPHWLMAKSQSRPVKHKYMYYIICPIS